jgi:hypothetical protein
VGYPNRKQIEKNNNKTQSPTNSMLKSEIKKKNLNPNKFELACKTRDLSRETEIPKKKHK